MESENGGVLAVGAEEGNRKFSDGNGELEVGFSQKGGEIEEDEEKVSIAGVSVQEEIRYFGSENGESADRFTVEGVEKKGGVVEAMQENPKRKRGRPKLKKDVGNVEKREGKGLRMENENGVLAVGAEGNTKFSDGNGEFDVGFGRKGDLKGEEKGSIVGVFVQEGIRYFGSDNKESAERFAVEGVGKKGGTVEVMDENPKRKRGRPKLKKEVVNVEVMEDNTVKKRAGPRLKKKRGTARLNRVAEGSVGVTNENPKKKRGRPPKMISKFRDGNGEFEVGCGQKVGEMEEERGSIVSVSVQEEIRYVGCGNIEPAERFAVEGVEKKGGIVEIIEKNPKRKRGRPKLKKEVGNVEAMEDNTGKKRGRPRLNREAEGSVGVTNDNPKKKRGMLPKLITKQEASIDGKENDGRGDLKSVYLGQMVLAREERAKGVNLECGNEEEGGQRNGDGEKEGQGLGKVGNVEVMEAEDKIGGARFGANEDGNLDLIENDKEKGAKNDSLGYKEVVEEAGLKELKLGCGLEEEELQENKVAEKEGKELGEENCRRSDEEEKGNVGLGRRSSQRKSKTEAKMKMMQSNIEDKEWEEEDKRTRKRRGESEVNMSGGHCQTKKRTRKRKLSEGVEKEEENDQSGGEFMDEKEEELVGAEQKSSRDMQWKEKVEEGKGEEGTKEDQNTEKYSFRARKENTGEASKAKRLKDENVRCFVIVKLD